MTSSTDASHSGRPEAAEPVPCSIVEHHPAVAVSSALPGRCVLLALDRIDADPIALEGTAVVIWDELDGRRSLREIADALAHEFDADPDVVHRDVVDATARFVAHGVARIVEVRCDCGACGRRASGNS